MERLFEESDVISFHCPLTQETEGILCRENLAKMKDGVILINTGRGGLAQEEDVAEALDSGKAAWYLADVMTPGAAPGRQPAGRASPLHHHPSYRMGDPGGAAPFAGDHDGKRPGLFDGKYKKPSELTGRSAVSFGRSGAFLSQF